jgi:hypothetical protein
MRVDLAATSLRSTPRTRVTSPDNIKTVENIAIFQRHAAQLLSNLARTARDCPSC